MFTRIRCTRPQVVLNWKSTMRPVISKEKTVIATKGHKEQGVVLLEALVAILIFSTGLLALMGMQAAMVKNVSDAKYRADASFIAQKRLGDIWADPQNMAGYAEVDTDISTLLPNGTRTVVIAGNQVTITVTWIEPGHPDMHRFTTNAFVAGG